MNTSTNPDSVTGMIRFDARDVTPQPRTALYITRPQWFYFEPLPPKQKVDSEKVNDFDWKHQVDPNRSSSCAAMMPDLERYRATGNPYPRDAEQGGEACVTKPKWLQYVALSHAVFKVFFDLEEGVSKTAGEIFDQALLLSGLKTNGKKTWDTDAQAVVIDTLRDLRLYGFVESGDAGRLFKKTTFRITQNVNELLSAKEAVDAGAY
jgi:hypothetical protein